MSEYVNVDQSPIRICYVIDNISFRGGERVFGQLATNVNSDEFDVTVVCSPGGPFVDMLTVAGVRVVPINLRTQVNPKAMAQLTLLLRRARFDIVHTQGRGDPYGRIAATLVGVPVVICTNAMIASRYWVKSPLLKARNWAIDCLTDRLVDHWLVLNQLSIDALVYDHGIAADRITLIPNGIEAAQYGPSVVDACKLRQELGLDAKTPLIGATGKLTAQKGFDLLLDAMPMILLAHPDAQLVIAGDGELLSDLVAQAHRLGVAGNCHFLGFRKDIPDVLAGVDVVVLSSTIEGMPMVLLEAMATAKPVVATRVPGIAELIDNDVDGLLIEERDPSALAASVNRILADRGLAARLSTAARDKVSKLYTVEAMVRRTEKVYRQLAALVRRSPGRQ